MKFYQIPQRIVVSSSVPFLHYLCETCYVLALYLVFHIHLYPACGETQIHKSNQTHVQRVGGGMAHRKLGEKNSVEVFSYIFESIYKYTFYNGLDLTYII